MALRWTATGMLEAERQFRRIIGYRDLAKLALAIERDPCSRDCPVPDRGDSWAPVVPLARVTGEEVIGVV